MFAGFDWHTLYINKDDKAQSTNFFWNGQTDNVIYVADVQFS